jgi:hypothetical protein
VPHYNLWTGVLKWQSGALVPVWMSPSPLSGPRGDWIRSPGDYFVAADVDGDGRSEVVICNDHDLWTGVLAWQGGALVPVWMSPSPLSGTAGVGDWFRSPEDCLFAADVDGDGHAEVLIANSQWPGAGWTGLLKWQDGALVPVWMTSGPLSSPVGDWRGGGIVIADVDGDGQDEWVGYLNLVPTDPWTEALWTGVLKWQGGALVPIWMSPSPLSGTGEEWVRNFQDIFLAADVDGDGRAEIVVYNNVDLSTGVLKWQGGALVPVWINSGPLSGPGLVWERGADEFFAADVDGDRQDELVVFNYNWTGVLKWDGTALVPVWLDSDGTLSGGPDLNWDRNANDGFLTADVDGDGHIEVPIYNPSDLWTGVLKW